MLLYKGNGEMSEVGGCPNLYQVVFDTVNNSTMKQNLGFEKSFQSLEIVILK